MNMARMKSNSQKAAETVEAVKKTVSEAVESAAKKTNEAVESAKESGTAAVEAVKAYFSSGGIFFSVERYSAI